jgi:hypothetical protein
MAATTGTATAASPTCTNAAVTCMTGTAADGSTFKAEVPADWNGTLLLYSHGYVPSFVPNPPADTWRNRTVADHLLAEGYALAGSSYASNGWAVNEALRDRSTCCWSASRTASGDRAVRSPGASRWAA